MIHLVILHSYPLYRLGLRSVLERAGDIQVVGETSVPAQALALVTVTHPEVVLLDGNLSCCASIELTSQLRAAGAHGIFVLSTVVNEELLFQYLLHGAAAYERSTIHCDVLVEKVRRVADGEYLISDAVLGERQELPTPSLRTLLSFADEDVLNEQKLSTPLLKKRALSPSSIPVSEIELAVLKQLMKGLSNKQIAMILNTTDKIIKTHLVSLFKRFGVLDRTALVVQALRHHVLSFGDVDASNLVLSQEALAERRKSFSHQKAS